MRKHLVWVLALAVVFGAVGIAQALNTQTIQVAVTPKKLPKKGAGKSVKLKATVSTRDATNPSARPSPSSVVNVDLDKDIHVFTKGLKTCNPSSISTASTATATQTCGKAKVSTGPTVAYGSGTPQNAAVVRTSVGDIPAVVTAFNGTKSGGKPTLVLHTVNPVSGTTVLVGKVIKGPAGYGTTLNVVTPPLAGGQASIIDFTVTLKKSFKFKGKKHGFIESTCKDKKIKAQARATFADGSTATGTSVQSCKKGPPLNS